MTLDYTEEGNFNIDMRKYLDAMIVEFPHKLSDKVKFPWTEKMFKVDKEEKKLGYEKKEIFHSFVMKAKFLTKRGRADVHPGIFFLAPRVKELTTQDWMKLLRVISDLKCTRDDLLTLETDNEQTLYWYVDTAFYVHANMKRHTGSVFYLVKGMIVEDSIKQKVNARSSAESDLIGVDDIISKILWTRKFWECQVFKVKVSIIYQDNTSTMKLQKNGKTRSGNRTRHYYIKYFYVTYLIGRGKVQVIYCPTDDMLCDYITNVLVGSNFVKFRYLIMNLLNKYHRVHQQGCVG